MKKLLVIMVCFAACKVQSSMSGSNKVVVLDTYYNNETNAKTGLPFHYLWTDTAMSGFSQFGKLFTDRGATLNTSASEPTVQSLSNASVFIIVDPDTEAETAKPNYMTEGAATTIANWVQKGGVLLMLTNDNKNAELEHFNTLARKFGMEFSKEMLHPVEGRNWNMGASTNLPSHPLFNNVGKIYLKEISGIICTGPAKPVLSENGKALMAEANYGKGYVLAVGDPWIYNEYIDHWLLPADFENKKAATNLVNLLLKKTGK